MYYLALPFMIKNPISKEYCSQKSMQFLIEPGNKEKYLVSRPVRSHRHKENIFGLLFNFILKNPFSILYSWDLLNCAVGTYAKLWQALHVIVLQMVVP